MKPIKRGIKLWVLADENGLFSRFEVYTGKKDGVEHSLGARVVKDLTKDFQGSPKQQRRSLQFADSAVVSLTSPVLSDQALEESSSSVTVNASASTEELPGPSGLSTQTASSVASLSFEEDVTSLSFEEDMTSLSFEEDVASVGATGSVETNTKSSHEILGKFVEEWLQVLGKEDMQNKSCERAKDGIGGAWNFYCGKRSRLDA